MQITVMHTKYFYNYSVKLCVMLMSLLITCVLLWRCIVATNFLAGFLRAGLRKGKNHYGLVIPDISSAS